MINLQDRQLGESWLMWKVGNWTAIDDTYIKSNGIAWLFKENGKWNFIPRITGNDSMFFNAILFLRLSLPFGIFGMIRWSSSTTNAAFWQGGIGWKLNGRLALTFRVQSDESAAAGTSSPNYFDGRGFNYGSH